MDFAQLSPGSLFAERYQLERLIRAGGMGAVYVAVHTSTQRRVALKVMRPEIIANPEARSRFQREAQVSAQIESPYCVDVLDAGVDATGLPYLVMELLVGEELAATITRCGPLPASEVVRWLGQVARALDRAHSRGIIHRDLKPENLYVVDHGDEPSIIKVLDFGIAKILSSAEQNVTQAAGTPLYMAPEQTTRSAAIGPATDIWALGLVAYMCLVARPYWEGDSLNEVFREILIDPFESPVGRASRHGVLLPSDFDRWFFRCVARDPSARFSQATLAIAALGEAFGQVGNANFSLLPFSSLPLVPPSQYVAGCAAPTPSLTQTGFVPPAATRVAAAPLAGQPAAGLGVTHAVIAPMSSPRHSWVPIAQALPAEMTADHDVLGRFLRERSTAARVIDRGLLALKDPRGIADYQCFTVFMTDESHEPGRLGTRTFVGLSRPLELHLSQLARELSDGGSDGGAPRFVVIVIIDSYELGDGVRRQIFEYRKTYGAVVVPIPLGEIRAADRDSTLGELFEARLGELHVLPDPYAARGPRVDPTRFFGRHDILTEIARTIMNGRSFVVLSGPPASGKSSLVVRITRDAGEAKVVGMRCAEAADRRVGVWGRGLADALGGKTAPETPLYASITNAARRVLKKKTSTGKQQELLLLLEDIDWLTNALTNPSKELDAERADARTLWTAIGEIARQEGATVIATGLRSHVLQQPNILGWENPVATQIHPVQVGGLRQDEITHMVRALGGQVHLTFEDKALEAIWTWSNGSVDVARRVCSRALLQLRRRNRQSPLAHLVATRSDVDTAARNLAAEGTTFSQQVDPWLSREERRVLYIIATRSPRNFETIKNALNGVVEQEACRRARDELRLMGFICRNDELERDVVAVPLLGRWIRDNFEGVDTDATNRRVRLVALGLAISLGFVAALMASGKLMPTHMESIKRALGTWLIIIAGFPVTMGVVLGFYRDIRRSVVRSWLLLSAANDDDAVKEKL